MKKWIVIPVALMFVLSVGFAFASDSRTPQHIQDTFAEQGIKANFNYWFPTVPQISQNSWSNTLILSNFNDKPIQVFVWFTTFGQVQTMKTYALDFFQKKIITLGGNSGFGDDIYDIYCGSDQFFGAACLLIEGGKIATAWPPVMW
jgi:hypothetical protein